MVLDNHTATGEVLGLEDNAIGPGKVLENYSNVPSTVRPNDVHACMPPR